MAFARFVVADDRSNIVEGRQNPRDPSWADVVELCNALNGKDRTTVTLSHDGDADGHMCISGRWNQLCMVYATNDNFDFVSLIDPSQSSDLVVCRVGGQNGEYERRKLVPLSTALEAAKRYFEDGTLEETLNWVSDN